MGTLAELDGIGDKLGLTVLHLPAARMQMDDREVVSGSVIELLRPKSIATLL